MFCPFRVRRYNETRPVGALSWAHCLWRIIPLPPRCGVRLSIVMTVLVTGATGFLGRRVVQGLLDSGQEVRVMVRRPGSESVFATPPTDVCYGNITDANALTEACREIAAVVHLVAVIRGNRRQFDAINRQGAAHLAAAARAAGSVRRIVHISAVGAANAPQLEYLYSKWQGEQEIINSGVPYTILRPSLIFGPGDEFTNAVAGLVKVAPATPVIGSGNNRLQPIHVEDVARCAVFAANGNLRGNRIVEIGGPEQLSYNRIVGTVAREMGRRRPRLLNVPLWAVRLPLLVMGTLAPRPPINRAMLQLITLRNVAQADAVPHAFQFEPRPMAGNMDYLRQLTFGAALRMNLGLAPRR